MLRPEEPVGAPPPRRVLVAGVSGVGKSTLARRIAERLSIPYTEIDALFHGPGWNVRASFADDVDALSSEPAWVTEWQYSAVRPLLAERADTLVWLDLPARVSYFRVVRRTVRRSRTREELWNGNVEPGLWHALTHREGIIRWAVSTRRRYSETVPRAVIEHPQLRLIRLRSQRDVEAWLDTL